MQHLLLINARTRQEQKKTRKLGDQIVNDPGTGENTKMRQNWVLTSYFQVADQREVRVSSSFNREIEGRISLFYGKYVSFSAEMCSIWYRLWRNRNFMKIVHESDVMRK